MVVQSNWSWLPTILLLGFYVDVSEKTIRLRLSGLKSRAHLIRRYSFQAQSSLHAFRQIPGDPVFKVFTDLDFYGSPVI